MGMSKDEFERIVKSIREVNQRGGYTTQGIIPVTLGSIFCCICTICVYCCVVDSARKETLVNFCSSLNVEQSPRGFTWCVISDAGIQLQAVPVIDVAPASFQKTA